MILTPMLETTVMALNQHQQLYEAIQKSNNPLITFRQDHNGDVIAGSLALAELLNKMGRSAEIVSPEFELPSVYKFLPKAISIKKRVANLKKIVISLEIENQKHPEIDYQIEDNRLHIHVHPEKSTFSKNNISINDNHYRHDLIIALNTPDLESLGSLYFDNTDFFYQIPIINIDHSPDNEHYGHINVINLTASSISEIIYDFIEQVDSKLLDEPIATYLLTGMVEKTKSFKIPSVTPKSLNIASQLVAAGAQRDSIVQNLYQKQTVNALKLWGRVLMNLKTDDQQKIAWAEVTQDDFQQTNSRSQDLIGAVDELISSIPTVELTALFYEDEGKKFCMVKAEKPIDLYFRFSQYNPLGSKNLISFELTTPPQNIINHIQSFLY